MLPSTVENRSGLASVSDAAFEAVFRGPAQYGTYVEQTVISSGSTGTIDSGGDTDWLSQYAADNAVLTRVDTNGNITPFGDNTIAITSSPSLVAVLARAEPWGGWAVVAGPSGVLRDAVAAVAHQPVPVQPGPAPGPTPGPVPSASTPPLVSKGGLGIVGWAVLAAVGAVGLALLWRSGR